MSPGQNDALYILNFWIFEFFIFSKAIFFEFFCRISLLVFFFNAIPTLSEVTVCKYSWLYDVSLKHCDRTLDIGNWIHLSRLKVPVEFMNKAIAKKFFLGREQLILIEDVCLLKTKRMKIEKAKSIRGWNLIFTHASNFSSMDNLLGECILLNPQLLPLPALIPVHHWVWARLTCEDRNFRYKLQKFVVLWIFERNKACKWSCQFLHKSIGGTSCSMTGTGCLFGNELPTCHEGSNIAEILRIVAATVHTKAAATMVRLEKDVHFCRAVAILWSADWTAVFCPLKNASESTIEDSLSTTLLQRFLTTQCKFVSFKTMVI